VALLVTIALGPVIVEAQAPAPDEPTLDELRESVANLRGGRIPRPTSYDALTPEQQDFVKGILGGPRGNISGSLGVMMVSPGLGEHAQRAIAYGRFAGREGYSIVPPKLSELAILMGARAWRAQYAWHAHHQYAVRVGLGADIVEAVRVGRRPADMERDVEVVYDFVTELLTDKRVSDGTFEAAREVLGGDRGIVDLVGTLGMYQMVAMMMVVDEFPLPEGVEPYFESID
jgi:4-carboxymuconolactone decarboxylase